MARRGEAWIFTWLARYNAREVSLSAEEVDFSFAPTKSVCCCADLGAQPLHLDLLVSAVIALLRKVAERGGPGVGPFG